MIHLVTFLIAHSDATQDEMATFIYNKGGALYSKQRISERLDDLEITKKKASIEAFQGIRRSSLGCSPTGTTPLLLGFLGFPDKN
jgi:hypothetical protein